MAVPAMEAWYQCGRDPRVTEQAWADQMRSKRVRYDKLKLKQAVYGTERAGMDLLTRRACEEAMRLAQDLKALEQDFVGGFGSLAREVRGWAAIGPEPA